MGSATSRTPAEAITTRAPLSRRMYAASSGAKCQFTKVTYRPERSAAQYTSKASAELSEISAITSPGRRPNACSADARRAELSSSCGKSGLCPCRP